MTNKRCSLRGATVGDTIRNVVAEFGQSTMGVFILEQAIKEALGVKGAIVELDQKLVYEFPRYQELVQMERDTLERLLGKDQTNGH